MTTRSVNPRDCDLNSYELKIVQVWNLISGVDFYPNHLFHIWDAQKSTHWVRVFRFGMVHISRKVGHTNRRIRADEVQVYKAFPHCASASPSTGTDLQLLQIYVSVIIIPLGVWKESFKTKKLYWLAIPDYARAIVWWWIETMSSNHSGGSSFPWSCRTTLPYRRKAARLWSQLVAPRLPCAEERIDLVRAHAD